MGPWWRRHPCDLLLLLLLLPEYTGTLAAHQLPPVAQPGPLHREASGFPFPLQSHTTHRHTIYLLSLGNSTFHERERTTIER
uniref:Putative secreted peptide n=1 Tax=Anopheles braziliensis TaxID=58242 RepID=A0A2M3ZUE4_9DIPT